MPEIQNCKADPRIDTDPFTRYGEPHKQPAECKGNKYLFPVCRRKIRLNEPKHEKEGKNDEQDRETVNCCDLCLGKMHAVKRHKHTGKECDPCFLCQLFGKKINARQHENTRKRTGKAPSEGSHSENSNAPADENLAERRMACFIRNGSMQKFKPCPCMIDLIKIGTVPPGWLGFPLLLSPQKAAKPFESVLFIQQIRGF